MNVYKKVKWSLTDPKIEKILTYTWTIKNYSFIEKQNKKRILRSPHFTVGLEEGSFYLSLLPESKEDNDYLDVTLWVSDDSVENTFEGWCYFSVLDHKGNKFIEKAKEISSESEVWSCETFLKKDVLWDKSNSLLPNNSLTIRCEFYSNADFVNLSSEDDEREEHNSDDVPAESSGIQQLFFDNCFSDVKLIASDGKSLPAHRNILAAFSPVFKAMFINDMREKSEGEVKIDDSRYEVLKEMLRFIYTGKVDNFATNAAELIVLADKYQLPQLRKLCEEEMIKIISIDNVLDVLAIAHQHNFGQLKNNAINFTKAYHREIIESDAFKSLKNFDVLKSVTEAISQMKNIV